MDINSNPGGVAVIVSNVENPLGVHIWRGRGGHSVIGVDDGDDVECHKLPDCVEQLLPGLVIVKILLCDQDLTHEDAIVPGTIQPLTQVFKRKY